MSLDDFIQNLQIFFKGELALNEAMARHANHEDRWVPDPEIKGGGYDKTSALSETPSLAWLGFEMNPQNPTPLTGAQVDKLGSNLQKFLDDPECGKFIKAMLGSLPNDVWKTSKSGGSLMDVFNRIKNGGGFWSGDTISKKGLAITNPNTMTTTFDSQRMTPLITGQSWQQFGVTVILAHELTHVFTNAPYAGVYGHLQMAQAASSAATSLGFDVKKALMLDFPTPEQYGTGDAYDLALSEYYNKTLSYACRKVKL